MKAVPNSLLPPRPPQIPKKYEQWAPPPPQLYFPFQAGPLLDVKLPVDRDTGEQRPYAFVAFKHPISGALLTDSATFVSF